MPLMEQSHAVLASAPVCTVDAVVTCDVLHNSRLIRGVIISMIVSKLLKIDVSFTVKHTYIFTSKNSVLNNALTVACAATLHLRLSAQPSHRRKGDALSVEVAEWSKAIR